MVEKSPIISEGDLPTTDIIEPKMKRATRSKPTLAALSFVPFST